MRSPTRARSTGVARLFVLGLATCLLAAPAARAQHPWPTAGWTRSTPAEQRLDPAPLAALDSLVRSGRFGNVDRLFVTRHGYQVVDYRYPRDYRQVAAGRRTQYGCGPGACDGFSSAPEFNYFDPEVHPFYRGSQLHSLQSATKSVSATVLGAALQQGVMPPLETPLLSLLSEYRGVVPDPARLGKATLADLLTMRSGIEWHEQDRPLDTTNTTLQLEMSPDWVRFTLSQPMDADPGAKWVYNSGGSHLISAVVRSATGQTMAEYGRTHVFRPLGISEFHWKTGGGGLPDGEGGLYLTAESLAKIGYLYLRGGEWDGQRILPADWTKRAVSRVVDEGPPGGVGYGYQWWRVDPPGLEVWAAMGFGGQFLLVLPAYDIVAVAMGWNVYGEQVPAVLGPFLQALRRSAGGGS
ncbi:MAG: serine hydrolase [Gemmatimonadales bacterium]